MVEGREEFVRKQTNLYMYMNMHNNYKQKVTYSQVYTIFYPSVKDQTLLQAPQRMSNTTQHSS